MILVQTSQLLQSLLVVLPADSEYLHFVPSLEIVISESGSVGVRSNRFDVRKELQSCLHNLQALEVVHHEERLRLH